VSGVGASPTPHPPGYGRDDEKARRMPAGFLEVKHSGLLAEFPTLHTSATKQLAVLLLRHTLAALLDN